MAHGTTARTHDGGAHPGSNNLLPANLLATREPHREQARVHTEARERGRAGFEQLLVRPELVHRPTPPTTHLTSAYLQLTRHPTEVQRGVEMRRASRADTFCGRPRSHGTASSAHHCDRDMDLHARASLPARGTPLATSGACPLTGDFSICSRCRYAPAICPPAVPSLPVSVPLFCTRRHRVCTQPCTLHPASQHTALAV